MKQINDRRQGMLQFLQPHMEECFQKTCELIQSEIESRGNEIWKELKAAVDKVLCLSAEAQDRQQKGALQYLVFSFLKSGIYLDEMIFRLEFLDDQFYLDEQETAALFHITFLEEKYRDDTAYLHHKAREKFVRLREHELLYVNEQYAPYYYAVTYKMLENLAKLIVQEIAESNVRITDKFKILYGEYMDSAAIIYSRETE